MQVLKDGKHGAPDLWEGELICEAKDKFDPEGCGAELKVSREDLKVFFWMGTHFRHHYPGINCPQCGKINRVRKLPQPVWDEVFSNTPVDERTFDGFADN